MVAFTRLYRNRGGGERPEKARGGDTQTHQGTVEDRLLLTEVHLRDGRDGVAEFLGVLGVLDLALDLWLSMAEAQPLVLVGAEPLPEVVELHALLRALGTDVPRDRGEVLVVL